MHQTTLYEHELPTAQQTVLLANQQRDPKRKAEAYKIEDFSFFKPKDSSKLPSSKYGSAALAMVKDGSFPSWALFCFKELSSIADPGYVPGISGFVSEDAILLHPVKAETGYKGLLIAKESASNQVRQFSDGRGGSLILNVPFVHTKIIAEEDITLYP